MKLLTCENAKTSKGESTGYLTGILYLSPASLSGVNLCPFSSAGCRAACLNTAGRGRFDSIKEARAIKTLQWLENPEGFIEQLALDIEALERKAKREGLTPVVRLNGTSDILWERKAPQLFKRFAHIQFYDYTKFPLSVRPSFGLPPNYHLTFSASETTEQYEINATLKIGRNVAIVFDEVQQVTETTVDGDEHDLRFLTNGKIVALKAKGLAKKDVSGFVRRSK